MVSVLPSIPLTRLNTKAILAPRNIMSNTGSLLERYMIFKPAITTHKVMKAVDIARITADRLFTTNHIQPSIRLSCRM